MQIAITGLEKTVNDASPDRPFVEARLKELEESTHEQQRLKKRCFVKNAADASTATF